MKRGRLLGSLAVVSAVLCLLLFSCRLFEGTGQTKIVFTVSQTAKTVTGKAAGDLPNELIYLQVDGEELKLEHVPLESGENIITVPKGGVYLIGLVDTLSSEGIKLIGEVCVASVELNSLPVSEGAADEVYLGTLTLTDSGYESTISGQSLADSSGYSDDSLYNFGQFDETVIKFLNPDINRNGKYDVDEGINWNLTVWYFFMPMPVSAEDYDANTVTIPIESFRWCNMNYDFWHTEAFGYFGMDDAPNIELLFPEDVQVMTWSGTRLLGMTPGWVDNGHFSFDTDTHHIKEPVPPYNGDYKLRIYNDIYYLKSINFLSPEEDFENFVFPIYRLNKDNDGIVTSVDYCWKVIENGQYDDASFEEVALRIKSLSVNWGIPGENLSGGIDVEEFSSGGTIETPAIDTSAGYTVTLNYVDLGNNAYGWSQTDN